VVNPNFPVNSVHELIDYLKRNPNKVTFAFSGIGANDHLVAALFWQKTGTSAISVPYKGGAGPAIQDLVAGHVNVRFNALGLLAPQIEGGQLKALAVTTEKRLSMFPNVPTMKELGIDDLVISSWQGMAVPKGTPKDAIDKLYSAIEKTLKDETVKKRMDEIGFEVVGSSPEEFTAFVKRELVRWDAVIKAGNIKVE
jgi:tripartite-type tricarboxylate transporter receptor subunit TctC